MTVSAEGVTKMKAFNSTEAEPSCKSSTNLRRDLLPDCCGNVANVAMLRSYAEGYELGSVWFIPWEYYFSLPFSCFNHGTVIR